MSSGTGSSGHPDQWISAAREGSQEAIGRMLEACRQYLLLVANQQLDADLRGKIGPSDIVQETFLEAQRDFDRFHGSTEEELLAWLRRILLNNLANVARHYRDTEKRRVTREVPLADVSLTELHENVIDPSASPRSLAQSREEGEELDRALAQLPEHYRQVIVLRHQEQLAFEEIGRRLGRSPEAVRKLWGRAVEQLQQVLEHPHES
jgi:RNA polymerase sigma-70 factor (ECF subfamily)